jgi:hypothetical protein
VIRLVGSQRVLTGLVASARASWQAASGRRPGLHVCFEASHCPCDFETPPWVFRYPETAPAVGPRDGDRSGAASLSPRRAFSLTVVIRRL